MTATASPSAGSPASASPVPLKRTPASAVARTAGKQTFVRALRSEWIKIRTLRSTWITSIVAFILTALIGSALAIAVAKAEGAGETATSMLTQGVPFGEIAVAVLGALTITGEYSSGQIRSTLAAVPNRTRAMAAKALVIAVWAFLLGFLSLLLSWLVAAPFMGDYAPSFSDSRAVGYIWGAGLAYAGVALLALGLGYLLRSTAGTITVAVVLFFVINIPLQLMMLKWDWAADVIECTPSMVIAGVTDPLASTDPNAFLTHTQNILVFAAWVLVPLIAGWSTFTKRDA